jgi:hypothetical protein
MQKKIFSLFLTLLVTAALAVLAQSPTSSAPPGGSTTKDPYGATLDHPNPGSTMPQPGSATTTTTTPAPSSSMTTTSTDTAATPSTSTTTTDTTPAPASTTDNSQQTLPRTGSDLPLMLAIGLLALASAFTLRTFSSSKARG